MTSKEISILINKILVLIMIFFLILDMGLILRIRYRKPLFKNRYIDFHRRYGLLRIATYKFIAAIIISWALLTSQPRAGGLTVPIIVYGMWVIKLLIDFLKDKQGNHVEV